jgi:hypothetical protein
MLPACGQTRVNYFPQGTIAGVLQLSGGPAPGTARPVSGTATIVATGGLSRTVAVGSNGRFSLRVAIGSYAITGRTPDFVINGSEGTCNGFPTPVDVVASQTATVTVDCAEK